MVLSTYLFVLKPKSHMVQAGPNTAHNQDDLEFFFCLFETGWHDVALAVLELMMQTRPAETGLSSAGVKGVHHP